MRIDQFFVVGGVENRVRDGRDNFVVGSEIVPVFVAKAVDLHAEIVEVLYGVVQAHPAGHGHMLCHAAHQGAQQGQHARQ